METPVTLPFKSGRTAATALAAPVVVGMMLLKTPRPVCRGLLLVLEVIRVLGNVGLTQTTVLLAISIQHLLRPSGSMDRSQETL